MKFGVREICDVTFKTTAPNQKVGNTTFAKAGSPCFFIDTAKTSSLEQATTTVYAQGGKGYNRLIAWEGEKTMTFTVEDALISPMGLAVLSGAGLMNAASDNVKHVHITLDRTVDNNGKIILGVEDLQEATGLNGVYSFEVCSSESIPVYATVIDNSGAGIDFVSSVTLGGTKSSDSYTDSYTVSSPAPGSAGSPNTVSFTLGTAYKNKTVKLDFYIFLNSSVSEIEIKPGDFGGFFYIEAQTLFRREDSGLDMAAEIILPRVKVQSGFTFSMAATGDPSTFTFTMDAFPGYTMFDKTKKVCCVMQMLGDDTAATTAETAHKHDVKNG